jgi:opine dehydrogenase
MPDSGQDLRAVLDAMARREQQPAPPQPAIASVAVLGAGPTGQLLAAEALAAGREVRMHSAFGRELTELRARGGITVRGRHLVGTYAVTESAPAPGRPAIRLSTAIDDAVAGADLVVLATPATVHPTYAGLLAHALPDTVAALVLIPGRFLGSVELYRALCRHGWRGEVPIAETAAVPYLARDDGGAIVVDGVAARLSLARLGGPAEAVAGMLAAILPAVVAVPSVLDIAFAGVTGVAGVAPVILNTGLVRSGQPPLWRELVTPHLARTILSDLDEERREVGFAYGARDLPSAAATLAATFGDDGEPVPDGDDLAAVLAGLGAFAGCRVTDADCRLTDAGGPQLGDAGGPQLGDAGGPQLGDDVPNVLVPLASAGRHAGVPTPATDTVVALASVLARSDFARHGRRLETLGLDHVPAHDLRWSLDAEFTGQRAGSRRPRN